MENSEHYDDNINNESIKNQNIKNYNLIENLFDFNDLDEYSLKQDLSLIPLTTNFDSNNCTPSNKVNLNPLKDINDNNFNHFTTNALNLIKSENDNEIFLDSIDNLFSY